MYYLCATAKGMSSNNLDKMQSEEQIKERLKELQECIRKEDNLLTVARLLIEQEILTNVLKG